jgi:dihydrofolate synthase/folylpolyglutamate synthase
MPSRRSRTAPASRVVPSRPDAILDRLAALHPRSIDLSLDRIRRLLAALDHPERRLPPTIHVAGTNGKGSTLAYLRAMYEAAGRRVHVYTSPHLVRFNERIRLAGTLIDDARLEDALARCDVANSDRPITLFEITTAAAFVAFADTPADVLLLETGLGGRLDATNVLDRPRVTCITPISLDHQDFLGSTIAAIAGEKAGIMRPGVPCVIGPQPDAAMGVFIARASALGVPLRRYGIEWRVAHEGGALHWSGPDATWHLPLPALPGEHQIGNAGMALACASLFGDVPPPGALAAGLRRVEWPARLQRLRHGPLVDGLAPGSEVWLDGGHNPAAGEVLAAALSARDDLPLHLVIGMINTKDPRGFLAPFAPLRPHVVAVTIPGQPNAIPADDLVRVARDVGLAAQAAPDVAAGMPRDAARVLICGSLYLAGTVLADNN